jgi:RimJ/RimL family protein N-acetyltransferase
MRGDRRPSKGAERATPSEETGLVPEDLVMPLTQPDLFPIEHRLRDGSTLLARRAVPADAAALLDYLETVGGESDFLSFGAGEFGMSQAEEEAFLKKVAADAGELYVVGIVDGLIVTSLTFSAGRRPRVRHRGEFGLSVRKSHWDLGIASLMLDHLIEWARRGKVVTKINLRVRADNERAIRLYERKGFVREGTITRESFLGGVYFSDHHMGLEL